MTYAHKCIDEATAHKCILCDPCMKNRGEQGCAAGKPKNQR